MKKFKKSKAKNVKKVIEFLNVKELLQIRGGDEIGTVKPHDFD